MKQKNLVIGIVTVLIIVIAILSYFVFSNQWKFTGDGPIKILHIMSYHSPWKWTDDQLRGFEEAFNDSGVELDIKVYQMDTKRQTSDEHIERVTQEAKDLIDSWKPDLVYTNDDNAQKFVTVDYIDTNIPFVFSAVNADPSTYGFDKSRNVAGVKEGVHFDLAMDFLRQIYPYVTKVIVITDDTPMWLPVIRQIKEQQKNVPDIEIAEIKTIETFAEYKSYILGIQNDVDAIMFLGIFNFKTETGENALHSDVIKWTVENSNLPDGSFWLDRVSQGNLFAMAISGYGQGLAAGKLARAILLEGKSPSSLPFEYTMKGESSVSLARAETLDVNIPSILLINSEVYEEFDWEKA